MCLNLILGLKKIQRFLMSISKNRNLNCYLMLLYDYTKEYIYILIKINGKMKLRLSGIDN